MTQHGSFPGRPRGRRARPDDDASEWAGYEATPADQREFPDLSPIRPREARARDGRVQDDWQAQGQAGGYGAGYPGGGPGGPGYAPAGPGQPGAGYQDSGYQDSGYQSGGYPGDGFGGPGQGGQAPWQDQAWPGQLPTAQQAPMQQAPMQPAPQSSAPRRASKDDHAEDAPEWAGPDADAVESFSQRWHRRGMDTREDRRADRARRRRLLTAAAVAGVVVVGGVTYVLVKPGHSAGPGFGDLVTSFLPGEMQSVPNACDTVPTGSLDQFLPGHNSANTKQAKPPLNTGQTSQCTWTLDKAPTYRVLEANLQAYVPSPLVANATGTGLVSTGNGSATFAAQSAIASLAYNFTHPAEKSGQPKATVTDVTGMPGGNETSAIMATQVFTRGSATTDVVTVDIQYRNVVITVVVEGLNQTSGTKYGPVSMGDLSSAAKTVAQQVAAKVVG